MRAVRLPLFAIGLALALATGTARAQTAPTRDDIVGKLNHFEAASEVSASADMTTTGTFSSCLQYAMA